MKKSKSSRIARLALTLCLSAALWLCLIPTASAASLNVLRFNRRESAISDAPPIGEGLESGAGQLADGAESIGEDIIDGAESVIDRVETNVPDSDIGGATQDRDTDGISDPTDPDDDNDKTPDKLDSDGDNDGISDKDDPDPDGDGVNEKKTSGAAVGIAIAVLALGAIAILAYALIPKMRPPRKGK